MILNRLSIGAKHLAHSFFRANFLIFSCFLLVINGVNADWNSGATIEDVSIRIAIDVDVKGAQVTFDLNDNVIDLIRAASIKTTLNPVNRNENFLNNFVKNVVNIKSEQWLEAKIDTQQKDSKPLKLESSITVFFPFLRPQPLQLEISPQFDLLEKITDKYKITVSHQGLPVIDHGVLTDTEMLALDWQDPWYSHFLNPKLKRGHSEPTMAFLYVNPQQIKSEIIVRVKEMAKWTDLELRDEVMIYPDEFAIIKQKVGAFLLAQNDVSVNEKKIVSSLDRVDYIRMGASDIQAYQPQQAQRQVATLIGVSIIQSVNKLPTNIKWNWTLFNEKMKRMAIRAYDPAGLFDSYVMPEYPIFEWENMLEDIDLSAFQDKPQSVSVKVEKNQTETQVYWVLALISLFLLITLGVKYLNSKVFLLVTLLASSGCGYYLFKNGSSFLEINKVRLDEHQAPPIIKQLLWNVYQAFESIQEDVVYDQLAHSVNGVLRETLYLQNRQAFLFQEGGQSKISDIKIQRITPINDNYLFDCEWLVIGDVIHWGHQHRRENLYHAKIQISPIEDNWKIIELESIAQQRID